MNYHLEWVHSRNELPDKTFHFATLFEVPIREYYIIRLAVTCTTPITAMPLVIYLYIDMDHYYLNDLLVFCKLDQFP